MSVRAAETSEQRVRLADGYERFVTRTGSGSAVLLCQHGGPGDCLKTMLPLRAIAGEGLGGMLALECALNHPDKVKSLILCDTMASTRSAVDGFAEILAHAPDVEGLSDVRWLLLGQSSLPPDHRS